MEHLRYVSSAVPVEDQIEQARADGDDDRRDRLDLLLAALTFAEERGLDVGGSYRAVADTSGLATAYVVTAAYGDRLEPYNWRYPIVGKIPYRGYFDRGQAEAFAGTLAGDGLDTYIVEASGYSTLGWFDDPLPSHVLDREPVGLVSFVFHELLHQTVFVAGSIDFNETLASAVSAVLTRRFFEERGDEAAVADVDLRTERWLEQAAQCDELALELESLFDDAGSADVVQARKRALYDARREAFRASGLLAAEGQGTPDDVLNNAWFLALRRYRRDAASLVDFIRARPSLADAIADIRSLTEDADDPYAALSGAK